MIAGIIWITFAAAKFFMLIHKHTPLMSQAVIPSFYASDYRFNLPDNDFKIAVSVVDYKSRKPKYSPEYVRWVLQFVKNIDGVRTETILK